MIRKNIPPPKNLKRKYKLEALLNSLTRLDYDKALRELPGLIGKCKNTLINYKNILYGSKESMPYEVGIIIERYFGIAPGSLSNVKIKI